MPRVVTLRAGRHAGAAAGQAVAHSSPRWAAQGPLSVLAQQESLPSYAKLTNELRSSIVRIEKIETLVNWFEPYGEKPQASAVGTGFAAKLVTPAGLVPPNSDADPVFITNAHVVQNAQAVKIQFPAVGEESFDGHVPVIYEDHDLAVVKLADPASFTRYLEAKNFSLRALPIRKHDEVMGLNVAAIGFPLGSSTLKLSTGVIAGTELVQGMTVFQCTAPISPGNSGGPLLELGDMVSGQGAREEPQVVGVNFAATTAQMAENVNYVVPAVHIRQILSRFWTLDSDFAQQTARAPANILASLMGGRKLEPPKYYHSILKLAPVGALAVHANEALYALEGCKEGVFISTVANRSALYTAKPRVEARSFIMAVDGVSIDGFGTGRMEQGFLGDPLPFQSLMQIKERVEDAVELTTCRNGTISKHTVSMVSSPEYEPGIRWVAEPQFEPSALDYEVFADVTVMQMTLNHVHLLMEAGVPPSYGRWLLEDNTFQPRLLITKVTAGTYASTVLAQGMVLASINGHAVSTLAEFREHFEPAGELWTLRTERGSVFVVGFAESLGQQLAAVQEGHPDLLTRAVLAVAQQKGLVQSTNQQAAAMKLAGLFSQMLQEAYAQGQASAQPQQQGNGTESLQTKPPSSGNATESSPAKPLASGQAGPVVRGGDLGSSLVDSTSARTSGFLTAGHTSSRPMRQGRSFTSQHAHSAQNLGHLL